MYCSNCGAEIQSDAAFCPNCGQAISASAADRGVFPQQDAYQRPAAKPKPHDDTLETLVKIFLVLGCISIGWTLIPLAWCIPITLKIFNAFRDRTPISVGLKVCALILVSPIAGIILLIMDEV